MRRAWPPGDLPARTGPLPAQEPRCPSRHQPPASGAAGWGGHRGAWPGLSHVTAPTRCRGVGGGVLPRCPVRAPTLTACAPRPQELDEAYQDAAGNVLVAICRHSWRAVAQHLEAEVLTGVFPHRSLLYVMGVLTSKRTSCPWVLRPPATLCHPPGLVRWAGHGETSRRGRAGKHVRGRGQWAADPAPHSALPSASRAGRDPCEGERCPAVLPTPTLSWGLTGMRAQPLQDSNC